MRWSQTSQIYHCKILCIGILVMQLKTLWIYLSKPQPQYFFYPSYSLDIPGPSIVVPFPHEEFFGGSFWMWFGMKKYQWILKKIQYKQSMEVHSNKAEQSGTYSKPSTRCRHETVSIRPWKNCVVDLMFVLKFTQVKVTDITSCMPQYHTS